MTLYNPSDPPLSEELRDRRWMMIGGAAIIAMCLCGLGLLAASGWFTLNSVRDARALANVEFSATQTMEANLLNPPAEWTGYFEDQFNNATADWDIGLTPDTPGSTMEYRIENGKYHWILNKLDAATWWSLAPSGNPDDFTVSMTGDQTSPVAQSLSYGFAYRWIDEDNFNEFLIDEAGYFEIGKYVNNQWQALQDWSKTDATDADKPNRIAIAARGQRFWFMINDQVVAQLDDPTPRRGGIAIVVDINAGNVTTSLIFDDFILRTPQ